MGQLATKPPEIAPNPHPGVAALLQQASTVGKSDPRKTLELASQAEQLALQVGDLQGRLEALGMVGEALYRQANLPQAGRVLEEMLALAQEQDLAPVTVKALNLLGHVQRGLGEHRRATEHYNLALEILHTQLLDSPHLHLQEIIALNGLAATYYALSDYQGAAELYLHGLKLAKVQQNLEYEGQALGNLGTVYLEQGELTEALELFLQGLRICEQVGNLRREAILRNNLGFTYQRLGEYSLSIRYSQEALVLGKHLGDPRIEASALGNLGQSHASLGQLERALELSLQALELEQTLGNRNNEADLLVQVGRIWLQKGQPDVALMWLGQALETAEQAGHRKAMSEARLQLANLHQEQGNLAKALEHHRVYHELVVSSLREQLERKTRALLIRFQAEQALKQAENAQLHNVELIKANEALHKANQEKTGLLDQLERMVRTDPLTGLYNRRYLEQELGQEFARARANGLPLSVAMLDIDHFKAINDTYSHQAGDLVLKTIPELFRAALPGIDLIARYGGEEFALVFPGTPVAQAAAACERLRQLVEAHLWASIHPDLLITVSIGVSDAPEALNHEKLLSAADRQLYQAKRLKRNRVCF